MTDNEMLLAMSNLLEPIRTDIKEMKTDIREVKIKLDIANNISLSVILYPPYLFVIYYMNFLCGRLSLYYSFYLKYDIEKTNTTEY